MTSTALIGEISNLSETANKKINARRAMITRELNSIEETISDINTKISSQQDTIKALRTKLLEKTVDSTKAEGEGLAKIQQDKQSLQLALATARKEQQRLISQNSELQGRLESLQSEFEKANSDNLDRLEQVKATLKMMTSSLDADAESLGTQLSNVNKGLEMVIQDPVLQIGEDIIPVEVDPQPVTDNDEPVMDEDEEEPELEDEPVTDEDEPVTDEDEPELEDEEESELDDVVVEGIEDDDDDEELELEFGKDDGIRIIDSDDEF
jgi:chromosome segregation ATPase